MAVDGGSSADTEAVRRELAQERDRLADSIDEVRRLADVNGKLRSKLPLVLAGAFLTGFVLSGGIGATARLFFRERREGRRVLRVGRYILVRS
jgi:hypothetical protein